MATNLYGLDKAMVTPENLVVTRVSNGWNVRMKRTPVRVDSAGNSQEPLYTFCFKCRHHRKVHYHHIVPRGAFKGKNLPGGYTGDEPDNKIPLCDECHVGGNGIHAGKWKIEDVLPHEKLVELRIRYGVRREDEYREFHPAEEETLQGSWP